MSPHEFKAARKRLGLSVKAISEMLGLGPDGTQVRRMEMQPGKGAHRPVRGTTERLMQAYLDGYRPDDWPDD